MNDHHPNKQTHRLQRPLLTSLRELIPDHELSLAELLTLIERQAGALRALMRIQTGVLPSRVVAGQPSLWIEDTDLPIAGYRYWDSHQHRWVICLNRDEPETARRFTLLHEFAHILWHGSESRLFPGLEPINLDRLAEHAADIFAGEALMPRRLVASAYQRGLRTPSQLARHFNVSTDTTMWKLAQLDLPTPLCSQRDTAEPAIHPRIEPFTEVAA
jgi:IrrE N-terminal-like domain